MEEGCDTKIGEKVTTIRIYRGEWSDEVGCISCLREVVWIVDFFGKLEDGFVWTVDVQVLEYYEKLPYHLIPCLFHMFVENSHVQIDTNVHRCKDPLLICWQVVVNEQPRLVVHQDPFSLSWVLILELEVFHIVCKKKEFCSFYHHEPSSLSLSTIFLDHSETKDYFTVAINGTWIWIWYFSDD